MIDYSEALRQNVQESIRAKQLLIADKNRVQIFSRIVEVVVKSYEMGGRLYIAGNGGSAADAQHLATEFVSKLAKVRGPLPAEAMTVDSSLLTAIGNDFGFGEIFSRQVEGKMTKRDVFMAITTSGQSENIIRALEKCRELGITSVLFTGRDGGPAAKIANYYLAAPGDSTSTIQETHQVLYHTLCGCVESVLFKADETTTQKQRELRPQLDC